MRILDSYDPSTISDLLARDEFFWLDLEKPDEGLIAALGEMFEFHPLALEDAPVPGQRPKLQNYGDHMFLVYYGARPEGQGDDEMLLEVHGFLSGGYIITMHWEASDVLGELRERLPRLQDHSEQFVIYRILEALTDSFFPALEHFGDQIDQLEAEILEGPSESHLERIFDLRRHLVGLRKVIAPQRDLLVRGTDDILELPGLQNDTRNYLHDLYDHMLRISDLVESYRDLLASSRDAYLSMVSNRLNTISKQLTIVATIFLPLAFITGFFGQNFKWMTDHIQSFAAFVAFGIGGVVFGGLALFVWFRRSGYL